MFRVTVYLNTAEYHRLNFKSLKSDSDWQIEFKSKLPANNIFKEAVCVAISLRIWMFHV